MASEEHCGKCGAELMECPECGRMICEDDCNDHDCEAEGH